MASTTADAVCTTVSEPAENSLAVTVWPLAAELIWDRKVSVGPPFFDAAFTPFMLLLAAILPVGALLGTAVAEATGAYETMARYSPLIIVIAAIALIPTAVWSDTRGPAPGRRSRDVKRVTGG